MQSKSEILSCVLAIILVLSGASVTMAQSSTGISATQDEELQVPGNEGRLPRFEAIYRTLYPDMLENSVRYRRVITQYNVNNPIRGRHYRDLNATDFQMMDHNGSLWMSIPLDFYHFGFYNILDEIRPNTLNNSEFLHVILRELNRRNSLQKEMKAKGGSIPLDLWNQNVTISRPLDAENDSRHQASIPVMDAVYRDAFVTLIHNTRLIQLDVEDDIIVQIRQAERVRPMYADLDETAFIIGYIVGANPLFFNGRQASRSAGPLPLTLGFNGNYSEAQVREAFCAVVPAIANTGRARGVDQNMAASAGFMLARHDARDNFASNDVRLGVNGVLCPATPPVWNHTIMGPAITGIDLLPERGPMVRQSGELPHPPVARVEAPVRTAVSNFPTVATCSAQRRSKVAYIKCLDSVMKAADQCIASQVDHRIVGICARNGADAARAQLEALR